MADKTLPLGDVIEDLRDAIDEAIQRQGTGEAMLFKLEAVELEFQVVAKREGGANGKIKFSIFGNGAEAGASGKLSSEQTQKVKLKLTPDTDVLISNRNPKPKNKTKGKPGAEVGDDDSPLVRKKR
jgi:hypothetical protein